LNTLVNMKTTKTYLNPILCAACGGWCCQQAPGECIPQDFGNTYEEIKRNLSKALKSGFYSVDWWEGKSRAWEGNRGFYVRPRVKGIKEAYDPSWGGECIFHSEKGCALTTEDRPYRCKSIEPAEPKCIGYFSKLQAVHAWGKYHELIKELTDKGQGTV
jgi:hypothetical protein